MVKPTDTDNRTRSVFIRLSDREIATITREAAREPLATFCRRIVLDYCERQQKAKQRRKGKGE